MTDITFSNAWMFLAMVGLIAIVAEIVIPGFVMLPIGIGMLLTAGVAYFVHSGIVIFGILAIAQALVLFVFRRYAHKLDTGPSIYTAASGMIGQECEVVETIPLGGLGYVKLYGDRWQARSFSEVVLLPGRRVQIIKVDGNKVVVETID